MQKLNPEALAMEENTGLILWQEMRRGRG